MTHRGQKKWHADDTVVMTQKQFRQLRPSRNIIVVMIWLCLCAVSVAQLVNGVSPDSVNTSLDVLVQDALASSIVVVSLLNIAAAIITHSGISLGIEIGAMVFGTAGFLVYTGVIVDTNTQWYSTAGFAWAAALFVGCFLRTAQIFRRGY